MMEGVIKKNNNLLTKNYGFITVNDDKRTRDYFFHRADFLGHWNELCDDVATDMRVEVRFDVAESPKGPRAANVERIYR